MLENIMGRKEPLETDGGSFGETQFVKRVKSAGSALSIAIKVAVPIGALLITVTWRLSKVVERIESGLAQAWTITDEEKRQREFRKLNPTIALPDSREIFESNPNRKSELIR